MVKFSILAAMIAAAQAGNIRLYPQSFNCGGKYALCKNVGNSCCGFPAHNFSSGKVSKGPSNQGAIFYVRGKGPNALCKNPLGAVGRNGCFKSRSPNGNLEKGGITGARLATQKRRDVDGGEDEECNVVHPSVMVVDDHAFYVSYNVPQNVTNSIYDMVEAGASGAEMMVNFAEYALPEHEIAALNDE